MDVVRTVWSNSLKNRLGLIAADLASNTLCFEQMQDKKYNEVHSEFKKRILLLSVMLMNLTATTQIFDVGTHFNAELEEGLAY